jgi:hypothetical protein
MVLLGRLHEVVSPAQITCPSPKSFPPARTGRRDLGGLLNDGINSLARLVTRPGFIAFSSDNDFYSQDVHLNFQRLVLPGRD